MLRSGDSMRCSSTEMDSGAAEESRVGPEETFSSAGADAAVEPMALQSPTSHRGGGRSRSASGSSDSSLTLSPVESDSEVSVVSDTTYTITDIEDGGYPTDTSACEDPATSTPLRMAIGNTLSLASSDEPASSVGRARSPQTAAASPPSQRKALTSPSESEQATAESEKTAPSVSRPSRAGRDTASRALPQTKDELQQLKKALYMELVWTRQAIDSRVQVRMQRRLTPSHTHTVFRGPVWHAVRADPPSRVAPHAWLTPALHAPCTRLPSSQYLRFKSELLPAAQRPSAPPAAAASAV